MDGQVIWAAPAIVNEVGEGADGGDTVSVRMYGKKVTIPVNLPSEARQIGPHLGRPVTIALFGRDTEQRTIEEQIVWHRGEVERLRELLAAKPNGEAEARVEVGRATIVLTMRTPDAEQAVATKAAEIMAGEDTARKIAEIRAQLERSNHERVLLVRMMRSALLIIDATMRAEKDGLIQISATHGTRWDDLRDFATNPEVRKWLLKSDVDDADFAVALKACSEPDEHADEEPVAAEG